jgi:hypothetical protein
MQRSFVYGTVRGDAAQRDLRDPRKDALIDAIEAGEIAERMREKVLSRGETPTDVVVVQGDSKETLRLYGTPYSVNRVRAAMFNAAISWQKIELE